MLQKGFLYAPKFNVTQDLLNEKPLITDKEILCLDTISGKIELTAEAINKIVDLKSSMKHGIKSSFVKIKNHYLLDIFGVVFLLTAALGTV